MNFLKDNRATAFAWLVFLITLFVCILVWGIMGPALEITNNVFNTTASQMLTAEEMANVHGPLDTMFQMWYLFPIILLVGLMLWAFASAIYHEVTGGRY